MKAAEASKKFSRRCSALVGKLIKNELKAGLHSVANIYIAAIAAVAFMAISLAFEIAWLTAISLIAVIVVALGILIVTLISVVSNFNTTLFRDQGYLSFTLPVTSGQLLFAKALCSFFWILLSYIALIGIFSGIFFYATDQVGAENIAMIKILISTITELPDTGAVIKVITVLVTRVFLKITFLIAEIYFAITLSNVRPFQRQSFLPAIIIFAVLFGILQTVSAFLTAYVPLSLIISVEGIRFSTTAMAAGGMVLGVADVIFEFVITCLFFWLSAWFMNHKINLK